MKKKFSVTYACDPTKLKQANNDDIATVQLSIAMSIIAVEAPTGDLLNNIVSNASKTAAASLTEEVRLELAPLGGRVIRLLPRRR